MWRVKNQGQGFKSTGKNAFGRTAQKAGFAWHSDCRQGVYLARQRLLGHCLCILTNEDGRVGREYQETSARVVIRPSGVWQQAAALSAKNWLLRQQNFFSQLG